MHVAPNEGRWRSVLQDFLLARFSRWHHLAPMLYEVCYSFRFDNITLLMAHLPEEWPNAVSQRIGTDTSITTCSLELGELRLIQ